MRIRPPTVRAPVAWPATLARYTFNCVQICNSDFLSRGPTLASCIYPNFEIRSSAGERQNTLHASWPPLDTRVASRRWSSFFDEKYPSFDIVTSSIPYNCCTLFSVLALCSVLYLINKVILMHFYAFMSVTREKQKFVSSTLNIVINTLHLGEYMESLLAIDYCPSIGLCVTLEENYVENDTYRHL